MALVERAMDMHPSGENLPVKWLVNIETLHLQFHNIPFFDDENLYLDRPNSSFHIVGGRSLIYPHSAYQKVFPQTTEEQVVVVPEAGHWVHFDKPKETINLISSFLD